MTLKSALQDIKETTLAAVTGLLGKLGYLASLRHDQGRYRHWGMEVVHGQEASERALRAAHTEVVSGVLRTPMARLVEDLKDSSRANGKSAPEYVKELREEFDQLLPAGREDSPVSSHLNSVLVALSRLEKHRGRATHSAS